MTEDDGSARPAPQTDGRRYGDAPVGSPTSQGELAGSVEFEAGPSGDSATVSSQPDHAGSGEQIDQIAVRLEELILGAERQYTPFQAARAAGVSMDVASRFWRAMGFADIGQSRALTDADVIALRRLSGLVESGLLSESMVVQVARSTGQTTARLAGWQMDTFLDNLTQSVEPGLTRAEVADPLVELLLPPNRPWPPRALSLRRPSMPLTRPKHHPGHARILAA